MTIKLILVLALAFVLSTGTTFAHETDTPHKEPHRPGLFQIIPRAEDAKAQLERREAVMTAQGSTTDGVKPPFPNRPGTAEGRPSMDGTMQERFEELREKFFERRERLASTTALRKIELTEDMRERILARTEHALALGDGMVGRLTFLLERLTARIALLKESGVDVAAAEALVDDAEAAITDAEEAMQHVKDEIEEALQSENPRDHFEEVKAAKEEAKAALRAAHQALKAIHEALPQVEESEDTNS